jgi:glycosyltransferase involved in cell wall biosynthesis
MRVLILTDRFPPEDHGGAERIALYHAQCLCELGWTVAIGTGGSSNFPIEMYRQQGLHVYRLFEMAVGRFHTPAQWAMGLVYNAPAASALRRAVKEFKPDLIHCHMAAHMSLAAALEFAGQIPTIVTFHGYQFECPKGGLYRKHGEICQNKPVLCRLYQGYNTRLLASVRRIVAISTFIEQRLLSEGYDARRVVYLPNGVPNLEGRLPQPLPASRNVLFVGQLEAHKGVMTLARAFRQVKVEGATLTIVGSGRESAALEEMAAADPRIHLAGRVMHDHVHDYYRSHRVVVVPSRWHEVMNTVICEAQSWGRPVVATPLGGNHDLIEDGASGLFVAPGDEDGLAEAITKVLSDEQTAEQLAAGGYAHVLRFTMKRHREHLLKLYEEVLNERG